MEDDQQRLLAQAWDEAAGGYERYFVPRFAPWVALAVSALTETPLPPGPILVACCGTFPEAPALVDAHPERDIVGIDLSAGMVRLALERTAAWPRVRVIQGDAATLDAQWHDACAGVVSVFGLQQLPDPEAAMASWMGALRPGGRLSVMFWPSEVEREGPFALLSQILKDHRPPSDTSWQDRLGASGGVLDFDEYHALPMSHPDAETLWEAMSRSGPLRALADGRGEEFMRVVGRQFLDAAPAGPWHHRPRARWIVARR